MMSSAMSRFLGPKALLLFLVIALSLAASAQQRWIPIGPDGGDVRSLAHDPKDPDRLYLGTSAGYLYVSTDGGKNWTRHARLGAGHNYVLDNIVIDPQDPRRIYVAAWDIDVEGGELFFTADAGKSWRALDGMKGQSIRALAIAATDPKILVAGTLTGVYRTKNGGEDWDLISPAKHEDIKNIESVAVDPVDPQIIYAGTWHLPWKTLDGGKTWRPIHKGMIDDSDVFSIIIDPRNPSVVYASACSGIYKSSNGGEQFAKVQGIPFSARRTRVLQQDPSDSNIVYAGTTEGLWKTVDAGKTWKRMTAANLIVNDVVVDPRDPARVLLATDRSGVLTSSNRGVSFTASNRGFAHRQVTGLVVDAQDSARLYAGVINDKDFGGVFTSSDRGRTWHQMSRGLGGRDVFTLVQSQNGTLLAGTNSGIFAFNEKTQAWAAASKVVEERTKTIRKTPKSKPVTIKQMVARADLTARINRLVATKDTVFAATADGLFRSRDNGKSWVGGAVSGQREFVAVHVTPETMLAAARRSIVISHDDGVSWFHAALPKSVSTIADVTVDGNGRIWAATREGAFSSLEPADKFEHNRWLPANNLATIIYDSESRRLLATSHSSTNIFESTDGGKRWRATDAGWQVRSVVLTRGRLLATTSFDGIVVEPGSQGHAGGGGGGSQQ